MARFALSSFLIAIAAFGVIEGTYYSQYMEELRYHPVTISIDTPLKYEKLLDGEYSHYYFAQVLVNSGAHYDVLGEAKRWARSSIYKIQFTDRYNNVIALAPKAEILSAKFIHGDLFNKLPYNYVGYDIKVLDKGIITGADKSAIAQWPTTSDIKISDRFGAPISLA